MSHMMSAAPHQGGGQPGPSSSRAAPHPDAGNILRKTMVRGADAPFA